MTPQSAAVPTPKPCRDETLVEGLVRGPRWQRIENGQARSIADLAAQEATR